MTLHAGICQDIIYNVPDVTCYLSKDIAENFYAILVQDGVVMVIRQVVGDSFVELYVDHRYATF